MLAFVRAVECHGFTPAAHDLGVTPSAVSKLVTRLERKLGVRLLQRSTRRLALTAEGEIYFERVQRIVGEIADLESDVMRFAQQPRGRVRISVGTAFATYALVPALPEFVARYPEITLDLVISEYAIDLVEAGIDLAIRVGPLGDVNLAARRIGELERVITAAPAYLAKHGVPRKAEDLARHNCLTLPDIAGQSEWPFRGTSGVRMVPVKGSITVNNAETLYELALQGLGVIRLSDLIVGPAIRNRETGTRPRRFAPARAAARARGVLGRSTPPSEGGCGDSVSGGEVFVGAVAFCTGRATADRTRPRAGVKTTRNASLACAVHLGLPGDAERLVERVPLDEVRLPPLAPSLRIN